jgi:hypothetical protein
VDREALREVLAVHRQEDAAPLAVRVRRGRGFARFRRLGEGADGSERDEGESDAEDGDPGSHAVSPRSSGHGSRMAQG